jgi:uncharacterized CHY-type Zn-finger protein
MAKKYSKDGPFNDPVVRCDSCQKVVARLAIANLGKCPYCGNRKVRSIQGFNSEELEKMKTWGIDPDFIALFEPIPEGLPV